MNETIAKISKQITDFWGKFSAKQKINILVATAAVLVALVALVLFLNQPKMVMLASNITPKQAAEIKDLLVEKNITHSVSQDGTSIKVEDKQLADAKMVLGQNGIPAEGFTYDDAFKNSFTTTEKEKQLKYRLAFEQELARSIRTMDGIKDAIVNIVVPDMNRTIFDENKESKASAIITTQYDISEEQVQGIVNFLAASVENLTPANVKVIDQKGKVLYLGESQDIVGSVNRQLDYSHQLSNKIRKDLTSALLSLGIYDDAEVVVNLSLDFNKESSVSVKYTPVEGTNKNMPSSTYHYETTGTNNTGGGVPGTDTNGANTDYMIPDQSNSNSSTLIDKIEYKVDETTTSVEKSIGQIKKGESSIAVVVNKYKMYKEEDVKAQGLLDGITFEQFKQNNMQSTKITIEDEIIDMVKNATGIDNVQVIGYEVPVFQDAQVVARPWSTYLPYALLVAIIGLLAFVIYKGTAPVELTEFEPELSVEELLATTKENLNLEEIEYGDKSEARKQIEKFVDEKPDAVAQLLRNWLNEDWE